MGKVWRAYDTAANNRTVAIKLLPSILASDSTFVQRFRREADAAAVDVVVAVRGRDELRRE
jgi:serine/threonine protein kinase